MSLLAVVLFLSGMVALLVGASRAAFALRAILRAHGGLPSLRQALPSAAWLMISVYGLVLASAGMLLSR
jgi:hypothetical protein